MVEKRCMSVKSVVSPSFTPLYFKCMKERTQVKSPLSVSCVGKLLDVNLRFGCMKERTLEKNPMNVNIVTKPFRVIIIFDFMKEATLERNPMNAKNVGKPSHIALTFGHMKEDILERNPTSVFSVADPSADTVPLRGISPFMEWKTRMNVSNIYFLYLHFIQMNERTDTGNKL